MKREHTNVSAMGAGAPPRRWRGDSGTGLVGTIVGFTIFVAFLLLAVQFLTRLYSSSTVAAVATSAAREVAESSNPIGETPAAEDQARRDLGSLGTAARFRWLQVNGQDITLRVTVNSPQLLPLSSSFTDISRTVTVRTERFR